MKNNVQLPKLPPAFIMRAVEKFRTFLSNLRKKLVPPEIAMLEQITTFWLGHAIHTAAYFNIADKLVEKPKTVKELADEIQCHEDTLYRIMRLLASNGIFKETEYRKFGLTPMGKTLVSGDQSIKNMVMFQYSEYYQKAWSNIIHSVKTGQPSFESIYGVDIFKYFVEHPDQGEYFNKAMIFDSVQSGAAVVSGYSFAGCKSIVDFGGGHGFLLGCILQSNPSMTGILFDLPHVVEGAPETLRTFGVEDRVQLVGGDFFKELPEGADAYIARNIIHDWDDKACIVILKNISRAMADKSKVIIVDTVISEDNEPSFGKMLDINMLVGSSGGRERTKKEYDSIFMKSGLKLTKITPLASPYSIIEGIKDICL